MRIVSWNVNGLYTTLKDAASRFSNTAVYFKTILHADVVCFQEAKIQEEKLEKWIACVPGFESFWSFSKEKKGYSGVVTYVEEELSPLDAASDQLHSDGNDTDLTTEGRLIETDHGSFILLNVYVPNSGGSTNGWPRLDFKLRFLEALKQKCDNLVKSGKHVLVVGDFNIAHKAVDVHEKLNVEEIYSPVETAWIDNFLTEYVDLFRHFHPDARDVYSVWEQKTEARMHNEGLRIDYAVCDKAFLEQVTDTQILKMVPKKWSDHAAVVLTLKNQPALPAHPIPRISSRNMKRFQEDRRQRKLTSLFSRGASNPMNAAQVTGVPASTSRQAGSADAYVSSEPENVSSVQMITILEENAIPAINESNNLPGSGNVKSSHQNTEVRKQAIDACNSLLREDEVHRGQFSENTCESELSTKTDFATNGKEIFENKGNCVITEKQRGSVNGIDHEGQQNEGNKLTPAAGREVELLIDTRKESTGITTQPAMESSRNEEERASPLKRKDPRRTGTAADITGAAKQKDLNSFFKTNQNSNEKDSEHASKKQAKM